LKHNYKSKFYLEQVEEDREIKQQREKSMVEKRKMMEKANSYAKYVREMYAPTVSEDPQRIVRIDQKENHLPNHRMNHFAEDRSDNSGLSGLPPPLPRAARRNGTADERSSGPHPKLNKLPPAPSMISNSVNISSDPDRPRKKQPNYKLKPLLNNGSQSEPETAQVRRSHPTQ
jgi:hypothetical protein